MKIELSMIEINTLLPKHDQRCIVLCDFDGRKYIAESVFDMGKHEEFKKELAKTPADRRIHRDGNFHGGFMANSVTHWCDAWITPDTSGGSAE